MGSLYRKAQWTVLFWLLFLTTAGWTPQVVLAALHDGLVLDYAIQRSFNGTSDHVDKTEDINRVASLSQGSIVVKFKSASTAQAKTFISASDTLSSSTNMSFTMNNGTVYFEHRENAVYATRLSASGTYNDGKWHTAVVTTNSTGTRIYVDAALKGTSTSTAFFARTPSIKGMWIGRNVDSSGAEWHYAGDMDSIKVYDRVLTAEEISELSGVPYIRMGYTIPLIDLSKDSRRQIVTDRELGQYLGHPDSVLLNNGTIYTMYPKGHGIGPIVMKKSSDGGLSWSERLGTPASWATSQETPTLYQVEKPDGTVRLQMISGLVRNGNTGFKTAYSEDNGATWSEFKTFYEASGKAGIVAMASLTRLKNPDGSWSHRYMGIFHDFGYNNWKTYLTFDENGNEQWSEPERLLAEYDAIEKYAGLCEIEVIRSPDGRQLALLARAQHKRTNAMIAFSNDEGKTWTEPKEMQGALMGERHKAEYDPVSGRLLITFRDIIRSSATEWVAGDWEAWVGTYEDLVGFREGQYRVKLMEDFTPSVKSGDTGYAGNVVYADGTYVLTSYGYFDAQDTRAPYIVTVRLKLSELDNIANPEPETITSTLTGPSGVQSGETFEVEYGLKHIQKPVQAQDIRVQYDASLLEFIQVESKREHLKIIETVSSIPGQVRLIVAAAGPDHALRTDGTHIVLKLRAKQVQQSALGQIRTTQAVVSDPQGVEAQAGLASITLNVTPAIPHIPGDINGDKKVSIGDLGIVAAHYGKNSSSPDWEQIKHADLTKDGSIDISDLVQVAKLVKEAANL